MQEGEMNTLGDQPAMSGAQRKRVYAGLTLFFALTTLFFGIVLGFSYFGESDIESELEAVTSQRNAAMEQIESLEMRVQELEEQLNMFQPS